MKVLLIEDSLTYALRMRLMIQSVPGWHVVHATTLGEAKEIVASGERFDVAVVDLSLPDADRLEAVQFARERMPGAACVVVTGATEVFTARAALREGADDYIVKATDLDASRVVRALELAVTRRDLHRQLEVSNENLQNVLTRLQDALFVINADGAVLFRNPRAGSLTVQFDGASTRSAAGTVLEAREDVVEQTTIKTDKDEDVPMEVRTQAMTWEGQRTRLVVLRDLRSERRAQDLEAHIRKIEELAKVGDESFKDWHDVKNKVQGIEGCFAQIKRKLAGLDPGPHPIPQPEETLESLVEEIAATARKYHQGGIQLRNVRESIDLSMLVESKCHAFLGRLGTASMVREIAPTRAVLGDPVELGGVVENLLSNAVKAVERNKSRPTPGMIRVATRCEGNNAVVAVTDDGPGFPDGPMGQWFEARNAGDTSGWGLGLARVREHVRKHGGDVKITSSPGEGATVSFWIPVAVTEAARKRRVLLVEDDPIGGAAARRMLGLWYDVVWCEDGQEALELLEEDQAFDVVICDLEMPRVDGVTFFLQAVQQWPHLRRRVAFCSGGALSAEVSRLLREEDVPMLVKPMRSEPAVALIERIGDAADA